MSGAIAILGAIGSNAASAMLTAAVRPSQIYYATTAIRPLPIVQDSSWTNPYIDSNGRIVTSGATFNIIAHGDSISGHSAATFYYLDYLIRKYYVGTANYLKRAIGSQGLNYNGSEPDFGTLTADAVTYIDPLRDPAKTNRLLIFMGTNDIWLNAQTGAATYSLLQTYLNARVSAGWLATELVVVPMLPRQADATKEGYRITYNSDIASDSGAIGYRKVSSSGHPWQPGDQSDSTWFNADTAHLNNNGQSFVATAIQAVM